MRKILKTLLISVAMLLLCLIGGVTLFLNFAPTFGAAPSANTKSRMEASANYDGKQFVNLVSDNSSSLAVEADESMLSSLYSLLIPPPGKNPEKPLPSEKLIADNLVENSFAWLGHSTILIQTDEHTILADPIFNNASPMPGTVMPFKYEQPVLITDLPLEIDVLLVSHDHYDHLDYKAIQFLRNSVKHFLVPLGIKAHLLRWGVAEEKIQEKDWYESVELDHTIFTLTPARHFSGRGLFNRSSTLWGSWVIQSRQLNVFINGDSGYFDEFKSIGEEFGPFDIAFIENGAYNPAWADVHMMPEQSVQASIDLQAEIMFPVHWGKFDLSIHSWDDPINRAEAASESKNVVLATSLPGQVFTLDKLPQIKWWR